MRPIENFMGFPAWRYAVLITVCKGLVIEEKFRIALRNHCIAKTNF